MSLRRAERSRRDPSLVDDGTFRRAPPTSRLLTSFVGRQVEIDELEERLGQVRLLTLVGAPGIGKTRLAREVSSRFADRRGCRSCVAELAPISDPSSTALAVAVALGVPDAPQRSPESAIVEHLAGQEVLLVLDNCEHVVDAVATLVARLLADCPSLRVLATSRRAVGLSAEQLWRVQPLDLSPAVQLFRERARLGSPASSTDDQGTVEQICVRLDGLPLAIELAAALTRLLSTGEILDRLDATLPLLRSGSRDVEPRQQTMEATIDWSYRLLTADERLLFDRLSVFAGGFDLAAAQAVGPGGDVLRGLATLVDHSLVVVGDSPAGVTRYRLLEPLRHYAEARLVERGERDAIRRRHAAHYLTVARALDGQLRTERLAAALRRSAAEDGNFRAALDAVRSGPDDLGLRLATALARSWALRGRVSEGRARMDQMLAVETPDRRLRASALARASRLSWRQHDYAATRAFLEESLAIERELDDQPRVARRLRSLAMVALTEGELDEARGLLEESIVIGRAHGDDDGVALALAFFAIGLQLAGRNDEAAPYVQEALELGRASGSIPGSVYSLSAAIFGAIVTGDTANLRAYCTEVAALLRTMGGLDEDPSWLWAGIALASAEGRYRSALRLAGAIDVVARRHGLRSHEQFERYLRPWLERARGHVSGPELARLGVEGARMTVDQLLDQALGTASDDDESPLSRRESEIAGLAAKGLTNAEIAEHLYISKRTVETHMAHIKEKLGLARRVEVVAWVLEGRHPEDQ